MTTPAPTFSQIKAQVAVIRQTIPDARVIGIRAPGRWTGERSRSDEGDIFVIEQCDSPLAMRIALRDIDDKTVTRVLITGLDEKDLGEDVLLRLARRRLYPIKSWQIVQTLFQARALDPRLTRHSWIADYLMEWIPVGGYTPVSGGFLDAETVWHILLDHGIGLTIERPDLLAVLKWSTDSSNLVRFRALPDDFREAIVEWLGGVAGPTTGVVLDCAYRGDQADALPMGLVAGVVFHPDVAGRADRAIGKLEERLFGGTLPDRNALARWNAAATEVVRLQLPDPKDRRIQLQRADEILLEVGAESFAYLSDTSPLGFDQRLAKFGNELSATVAGHTPQSVDHLVQARRSVLNHDLRKQEARRLERVDMAMRLVRWLSHTQGQPTSAQSLADAVDLQLTEGSFVDWARLTLRAGDPVRGLSEAYAQLFGRVTEVREQQARRFAELLRDWTGAGSSGSSPICIENILERVVAPLAAQAPVLVIVIDGMSMAVCRELISDIARYDWIMLGPEGLGGAAMAGLATIPSVTETSRTSLLCGQRRQGQASDEVRGFEAHPALLKHCRSGSPPVLFHKTSLKGENDAVLASEVRNQIGSSHRRVVGVVVNAVDDHLLKGQQIDTRWSRDEIKVLPSLLHEAKVARRLVVLLSDHGHVLDHGTSMGPAEGNERWRTSDIPPQEGELLIEGSRVMLAASGRLVAPWTESLRYSKGVRNGYHGGITPQEMVLPIAVLSSSDVFPTGWGETPDDAPDWWDFPDAVEAREPLPKLKPVKAPRPKRTGPGPVGTLFEMVDDEPIAASEPAFDGKEITPSQWIAKLLSSEIYESQKQIAGRALPADDVLVKLLTVLDGRNGKMTSVALARAISYPPLRLRGLLAVVQRMLNIDGYPVVIRDEASDTIEFDRELLCKQFDLV